MSKRTRAKCEQCGEMWFILIRSNGKMSCRICVAKFLSQDAGCSICRTTGTARRWYKNRGSLCVNCLVAAMSADEDAINEEFSRKQQQAADPTDYSDKKSTHNGIYAIGSDAWIEDNENHRRVLQAWAKEIGRTQ